MLIETGVPMVAMTLLGVALGMAVAYAVLDALPRPDLTVVIGGGLLVALAVSMATLPMVATRHDTVRFE